MASIYALYLGNAMYIGKTKRSVNLRVMEHINKLNKNKHHKIMQKYWELCNVEYRYEILEKCTEKEMNTREKYYIEINKERIINAMSVKNNKFTHSDEVKNKMIGKFSRDKNVNSKINIKDCLKIKKMLLENTNEKLVEKYKRIAKKFNINYKIVERIKNGNHWSNKEIGSYIDWKK